MVTLQERATAILNKNARLCDQVGTGFHADDHREKGRPMSPQNRGLPAIADHVVAFQGRWEHTFVGSCASTVANALKQFADENEDALTTPGIDPTLRSAVFAANEYGGKAASGSLVIRNGQWNDVVHALDLCGLGVTVAGEKAPAFQDSKNPA